MTLTPYNRRSLPQAYDKGFLDQEHVLIQHAIDAAQTGASGVTAGTYGDATHVSQVTVDASGRVTAASQVAITTGQNAKILAADVSNSSSTTHTPMGLSVSVTSGVRVTVRWTVLVVSAGDSTGVLIELSHPGLTTDFSRVWYSNTGVGVMNAAFVTSTGASPIAVATTVSYIGNGYVQVEAALVPSASGSVDLLFRPNSTGNTKTVKAGSLVEWWT